MADFLLFLGILIVVSLLFVLPGMLLWRLLCGPRRVDHTYLVGIGLGFALVVFISVTTAELYRYSFGILLGEVFLLVFVLFLLLFLRGRLSFDIDVRGFFRKERKLLLFFILSFVLYMVPVFVIVVPFDTDAEGFGFNALAVREGGTSDTLAPFFSDVYTLYPPGYFVMTAFLSDFFGEAPIHEVMLILSHLTGFLVVLVSYFFGRSLFGKAFGIMVSVFSVLGFGLFTSVMDSHYPTILGLLFALCFLVFFFRNLRRSVALDMVLAGFFLGMVCLTHPDTLVILLIAWLPFYIFIFLCKEKVKRREYLYSFILIPFIGVLFTSPWLVNAIGPIFSPEIMGSGTLEGFTTSYSNWTKIVLYQGILVPILAIAGIAKALKRRLFEDVFMVLMVIFSVEFSMIGLFERLGGLVGFDMTHHFFPPNIAWAGVIMPFAYLAALFISGLKLKRARLRSLSRIASPLMVAFIALFILLAVFSKPVVEASKGLPVSIYGTFSTEADVDAMLWLKENSAEDAIVLNYPLGLEAHWLPVISERRGISNRNQPYFMGFDVYASVEEDFADALEMNDSQELSRLLEENDVSYVFVSQLSVNRSAYLSAQTWQRPVSADISGLLGILDLRKVYDDDGAAVYLVAG